MAMTSSTTSGKINNFPRYYRQPRTRCKKPFVDTWSQFRETRGRNSPVKKKPTYREIGFYTNVGYQRLRRKYLELTHESHTTITFLIMWFDCVSFLLNFLFTWIDNHLFQKLMLRSRVTKDFNTRS